MPSLVRLRDGKGDSGGMSKIFRQVPGTDDEIEFDDNQKPRLGWGIMVGSNFAGSYSKQDWWGTTPVTEILEESKGYVRFKTKNSEYEWKS